MRKNKVERDRPQMAMWRMRIACWISKATDIHSEYVIRIAIILQQWFTRTLRIVTLYVHCLSCINLVLIVVFEGVMMVWMRGLMNS
jgi:hypothetical protein